MSFQVSTRLDDIYFDETIENEAEALRRARSWAQANFGDVLISHEAKTYTIEEFTARTANRS